MFTITLNRDEALELRSQLVRRLNDYDEDRILTAIPIFSRLISSLDRSFIDEAKDLFYLRNTNGKQ